MTISTVADFLARHAPTPEMEVVLHIGRHKTGTSALQQFFTRNRRFLSEFGVVYPPTGRYANAHHLLATMLNELQKSPTAEISPEYRKHLEDDIAPALGRAPKALFSSESFQNVRPKNLHKFFRHSSTTVIVYIREQYRYAQSAYMQRIHGNLETRSFEEFLNNFNVDYSEFLDPWDKQFAPKEMLVRPYPVSPKYDGDIVRDFLGQAGLPYQNIEPSRSSANISIGGPLLEFKRFLNTLAPNRADLTRLTYRSLAKLASSHPKYRVRPGVSHLEVERYRQKFVSSNETVARKYLGASELFARDKKANDSEQANVIPDIAIEEIEEISNALLQSSGGEITEFLRSSNEDRLKDLQGSHRAMAIALKVIR